MYWHYKEKNYDYNVSERFYREQDYEKKMSQQIFGLLLPKYFLIFCIPANELLHSRVNDTIPNKECVAIDSIEL